MNPYQKPTEGAVERKTERFDAEAAGIPPGTLRVMLGLVVLLGATLGVVVGSRALAVVDRITPVSWFVFDGTAVVGLIGVFLIAGAALGWIAWTLQKKGYPRRRLTLFGVAGWAFALLCLWWIVRSDTAMEQRRAEAACASLRTQPGAEPAVMGALANLCEASFMQCRRWLRQQPGYDRLTPDAENALMKACLVREPPAQSTRAR